MFQNGYFQCGKCILTKSTVKPLNRDCRLHSNKILAYLSRANIKAMIQLMTFQFLSMTYFLRACFITESKEEVKCP